MSICVSVCAEKYDPEADNDTDTQKVRTTKCCKLFE